MAAPLEKRSFLGTVGKHLRDYFVDDILQIPQKVARHAFKTSSLEQMEVCVLW